MDAISSIHTVEVSLQQLHLARAQLTAYLQRFRNRLKGKNRVYVTQVVRLLDSISNYLQSLDTKKGTEGILQATDLLKGKGVDQINLYKLMHYLQESRLARKVESYVSVEQQKQQKLDKPVAVKEATVPVLTHITNLFVVLTNPAREGRLFYTVGEEKTQTKVKYMLLDPSEHFRDIVEEARAVVLAGGTMSPVRLPCYHSRTKKLTIVILDVRLHDPTIPLPRQDTHHNPLLRPRNPHFQSLRQPCGIFPQQHRFQL
jgi:chromosome transmission fidelity protein 1